MLQQQDLGRGAYEPKINSIQVLRGIAALLVTVYHLKEVMDTQDPFHREITFLFNSGPAGVSLFFVISGFIMVYITRTLQPSARNILQFFAKRLIRIWPAYAVITLGYCFLLSRLAPDAAYLRQLVLSLLFIPASTAPAPFYGYATLSVGWSLNYEIYFYLLITISSFFNRFRWYAFFGLIALTLVGLPTCYGYTSFKADRSLDLGIPYLNMIANPIVWNFVYGVVIGLAYANSAMNERLSKLFSHRRVTYGMLSIVIWQFVSGFLGGFGPLEWGAGSAILFTTFVFHFQKQSQKFPPWLIHVGNISFSIYLLHLPVMVGIAFLFRKLGYPVYGQGTAMFLLSVAVTLVASNVSYEYLELKSSAWIRERLGLHKSSPVKSAAKPVKELA
nr:acyltransferase [uncultured Dyadobacter sp.]